MVDMRVGDTMDDNFEYIPLYKGTVFDYEDIYKKIKDEIGIAIKDNPNYYIGYTGASDDDGISETFTTDFVVYQKIPKVILSSYKSFVPQKNTIVSDKNENKSNSLSKNEESISPISSLPQEEIEQIEILEENPKVVRVIRRKKNNLTKILAALLLTGYLLAPIGKETEMIIDDVYKVTSAADLKYSVSNTNLSLIEELNMVSMNDMVVLDNGLIVYNDSLLHGHTETIGDANKHHKGAYEVTGFGVSYKGKLLDYIENFNGLPKNINLGDYAKEICDKNGISIDDVDITIHFGNGLNNTRAGWVNVKEVLNDLVAQKKTTYNGTIDDYALRDEQGNIIKSKDFIELKTSSGIVKLPIYDQNGNMYQVGDVALGDDGSIYLIESINEIENKPITNRYHITKENEKLSYRLRNVTNLEASIVATLAVLAIINEALLREKNKKLAKSPYYSLFKTEEEYQKFIETFTKNQLQKRINKIEDRLKKLTPEEIRELYHTFINLSTLEYTYEPGDELNITGGKFIVFRKDKKIDITNIMLERLNDVFDNSLYEQKGLLKDEYGNIIEVGGVSGKIRR